MVAFLNYCGMDEFTGPLIASLDRLAPNFLRWRSTPHCETHTRRKPVTQSHGSSTPAGILPRDLTTAELPHDPLADVRTSGPGRWSCTHSTSARKERT